MVWIVSLPFAPIYQANQLMTSDTDPHSPARTWKSSHVLQGLQSRERWPRVRGGSPWAHPSLVRETTVQPPKQTTLATMSSSPDTIDDTIPTESNFSTESYFLSQPPPPGLEARVLEVQKFVDRWAATDKRVVVVTVSWAEQDAKEMNFVDEGKETIVEKLKSGGTTVPLESNT